MNTLLIASTTTQAGKGLLAAALDAYWQVYRQRSGHSGPMKHFAPAAGEDGWLDLAQTWQTLAQRQESTVLLELPGSLGTPLTPEVTVADVAWDWRLPTVLVAPATPDVAAQVVAHVALARQARVHLKGIVVNHLTPGAMADQAIALIQSLTQVPVLGQLAHLPDPQNLESLAAAASGLDLERLFPLAMLVTG